MISKSSMIQVVMTEGSPVAGCNIPGQVLHQGWWFGIFARKDDFVTLAKKEKRITFGDVIECPEGMKIGRGTTADIAFITAQQLAWGIQG